MITMDPTFIANILWEDDFMHVENAYTASSNKRVLSARSSGDVREHTSTLEALTARASATGRGK